MNWRGLQKFSLIDYPGKLCCVVFSGGCNFRCPFCHNPSLVFDPASQPEIPEAELLDFLRRRRGKLDGVVFSGGEPTLQPELPDLTGKVKELGFLVKLDTNGSSPGVIEALRGAGCLDALGIDYKAPAMKYAGSCGVAGPEIVEQVHRSIHFAVEHGIELDVRTTVHRALLSEADLMLMYQELHQLGVKVWTLQQFHHTEVIDDDLLSRPTWSDRELRQLAVRLGPEVRLRGLTQ